MVNNNRDNSHRPTKEELRLKKALEEAWARDKGTPEEVAKEKEFSEKPEAMPFWKERSATNGERKYLRQFRGIQTGESQTAYDGVREGETEERKGGITSQAKGAAKEVTKEVAKKATKKAAKVAIKVAAKAAVHFALWIIGLIIAAIGWIGCVIIILIVIIIIVLSVIPGPLRDMLGLG